MQNKFCVNCGTPVPATSAFCPNCGAKQPVAQQAAPAAAPAQEAAPVYQAPAYTAAPVAPKKPKKQVPKLITIIRNSVIAAVAIIALIFAFLPVISVSTEEVVGFDFSKDSDEEGYYIKGDIGYKISPIGAIGLLFDSMESIDDPDDVKDLAEEAEKLEEEMADLYDTITEDREQAMEDESKFMIPDEYIDLMAEYQYLELRATLMSEDYNTPIAFVFTALVAIVYILAAVALFVLAVFNTLGAFGILCSADGKVYKWTLRMLALVPAMLIALMATAFLSYAYISAPGIVYNVGLTAGGVATLICTLVAILGVCVLRIMYAQNKNVGALVARGLSLVFAVLIIVFTFSPIVTATVEAEFRGEDEETTVTIGVSAAMLALLDNEYILGNYSHYEDADDIELSGDSFNNLTVEEAETNEGEAEFSKIFFILSAAMEGEDDLEGLNSIFTYGAIFYAFTAIATCVVMWQNLLYLAKGTSSGGAIRAGKIVGLLSAIFGLIFVILMWVIPFSIATLDSTLTVGIGAGAVALLVFAIAQISCPAKKGIPDEE